MKASELIERIATGQTHLNHNGVSLAVQVMLQQMSDALADGERIEIRGFGTFHPRGQSPRMGRNPNTGQAVAVPARHSPRFRPGKELRERVNRAAA